MAKNHVMHACTKHIEVWFHFVREQVAKQELDVRYVPTDDQVKDAFTKPLPISRFPTLKHKFLVLLIPEFEKG